MTIICKDFAYPHMAIYLLSLFESLDLYKSLRITFVQASKVKTFLFKKCNEVENAWITKFNAFSVIFAYCDHAKIAKLSFSKVHLLFLLLVSWITLTSNSKCPHCITYTEYLHKKLFIDIIVTLIKREITWDLISAFENYSKQLSYI